MTTVGEGAAGAGGGASQWVRYLARPVLVLVLLMGLVVWFNATELDSIEARLLNGDSIIDAVLRHIYLVSVSTILVVALAIPAGIALTRRNRMARTIGPPILAIANAGQSVPSLGILVLIAVLFGALGVGPTIVALVLYAFLPILRNTIVGIEQVDESIIESARGMGMTKNEVLRGIELPLAVPVMLAGVRTALVINVGTATVATLVNSGGLGDIVYGGIVTNRSSVLWAGALLVGVLAISIDYLGALAEDKLRPRGI
jgi:osmoprotectant transport system permease protein